MGSAAVRPGRFRCAVARSSQPFPFQLSSPRAKMVTLTLPPEYGYVVLVAAGSYFMNMYLGIRVGQMRKKTGIKYPIMYSDKDMLFNCYQRAHQNTLEVYPATMILLLLGGIHSPLICAAGGALWIASRFVYAHGYYTGEPKNRMYSAFGYLGVLAMLYSTVRLAGSLLHWF